MKSIVGFQGPRYNPVARKTFLPEADSRKNQRLLGKEKGKGEREREREGKQNERKIETRSVNESFSN